MSNGNYGREWIQTQPVTWGASAVLPLTFQSALETARRRYRAPVIEEIDIRCQMTVTTATAGLAGIDQSRVIDEIRIKDTKGERIEAKGWEIRNHNIFELGDSFVDPATTGVGAGEAVDYWLRLPFKKRRGDADDALWPVEDLLFGGTINIRAPAALIASNGSGTTATITAGTYTPYFLLSERGERGEVFSREVWKGRGINALEQDDHPVGGILREAWASAVSGVTYGLQSWSSMTEIDSEILGYADMPRALLVQEYLADARGLHGTDPISAGTVFPIIMPQIGQRLDQCPDLNTMDLKFSGTTLPTGARLFTVTVTDHSSRQAANAAGYDGESDAGRARFLEAFKQGVLVGKGGIARPYAGVDPRLIAKLRKKVAAPPHLAFK